MMCCSQNGSAAWMEVVVPSSKFSDKVANRHCVTDNPLGQPRRPLKSCGLSHCCNAILRFIVCLFCHSLMPLQLLTLSSLGVLYDE